MDFETAEKRMQMVGQKHLLETLDKLTHEQKTDLFKAIANINLDTLLYQQKMILQPIVDKTPIEPFKEVSLAGNIKDASTGQRLISEGKVGCLIVAGGEGSRLGFNGPKGTVAVSKVRNKSLYQIFAEKIVAASRQTGRLLPVAIMTSPLNDEKTKNYFTLNNYFGLNPQQLFFFTQEMLPLLDTQGKMFLNEKHQIAVGPDGNGSALHLFVKSGIWDTWRTQGVEYLNFVIVDNLLGEPFDPEFVGFQHRLGLDVAIKVIRREKIEKGRN